MIDLLIDYFKMPGHGATAAAWTLFVYALVNDLLPYSSKLKPNGVAQAFFMGLSGFWKAITIDKSTDTITIHLDELGGGNAVSNTSTADLAPVVSDTPGVPSDDGTPPG